MNITTLTNNGLSARLFAGLTVLSLLLSALPVAFFVANAANTDAVGTVQLIVNPNPESTNPEIASVKFLGTGTLNLEGWTLSDDNNTRHAYKAGTTLTDNERFNVCGNLTFGSCDELIDNGGNAVWNNSGDTATLRDENNVVIATATWGDVSGSPTTIGGNPAAVDFTPVVPAEPDFEPLTLTSICTVDGGGMLFRVQNTNKVSVTATYEVVGNGESDSVSVAQAGEGVIKFDGATDGADYTFFNTEAVTADGTVVLKYSVGGEEYSTTKAANKERCPDPEPETPTSQCIDIDENLLANGSFEAPEVTNGSKWQKFNTAATGWTTTKLSDGTPTTLELQRDLFSNQAADGDQYAELDGDHSTRIAQTIATLPGGEYELSWAFAGRHNAGGDIHNQMDILVNGASVATEGPQTDPAGLSSADWIRTAVTLTADSESTEIAFADLGPSNSFGTYLDDAQLCLVEEPEPVATLHAAKIVCTDEADLPNGDVELPITADTAADWLAANPDSSCALAPDWEFEWGAKDVSRPNSTFTGPALDAGWNTFSGSTSVPLSEVDNQSFWVREVLPVGYIPFSYQGPYGSDKNFTAELNCHVDGVNFDNADRVDSPVEGGDYYCIAWNAPVDPDPNDENQFTFSGIKFNNENQNHGRETGEETLYDWDFNLYKEVGGVWTFVASTTVNPTDAPKNAGKFVFPQQTEAGTYHVCEERQFGWEQVRQDWSGTPYHIITDNLSPNAGIEGSYCATAVYTDEADRSKAAYFGNYLKEIPTQYADVTVCKEDEQGNQLSGWQLALLGDTVDTLAFAPTAATQSMTAIPAGDYVIKAEGAYGYGNGGRFADARFSERKAGEVGFATSPFTPWREALEPNQGLAVQVEGDSALWGSVYSPAHVYYGAFTQASLQDIDFSMYDNQYADNSGAIDLTLYQGFTGITDENGCVIFEDVPYGDYEVAELLQGGFENTSGLGSVVVDEDQETFTVVNNDLSFVPPCELDIYSDEMTLVKETNQTAEATYDGNNNWTANIANAIWVWATGEVEEPEEDETYTFVETFTVTNPSAGNLTIAHDNWLKLTINDTVIERDQNGFKNFQMYDEDILAALVSGENRIEMEVKNIGTDGSNYLQNPAGALFHIAVTGEGESCARTTEPEVETMYIDGTKFEQGDDYIGFVAGWEIELYEEGSDVLFAATTTDKDGYYYFEVPAGDYDVYEVSQSGWSQDRVVRNGIELTLEDDVDYESCKFDYVTQEQKQQFTCDFYNERDVIGPITDTISGFKYNDLNGNGVRDDGEEGLSGWEITATEIEGLFAPVIAITNDTGYYEFNLPAGEWSITEEEREDWTQIAIEQNGDAVIIEQAGAQCSFNTSNEYSDFYFATESGSQFELLSVQAYTCDFYNQPIETETIDPVIERQSSSRSSGTRTRLATPEPAGLVAGVTTDMCPFLTDYMQMGADNDPMEVMKLQLFLNIFKDMFDGTANPVTGTFGATTDANVKAFQEHFKGEILDPWYDLGIVPHNRPTGFVYKTTLWKINSIVCPDSATLPELEGETLQSNTDINVAPIRD